MKSLNGIKIVLGITGSIAAYKAAFLVRLLIKQGADVKVIMTPSATTFISPLTLSTLSKHPVYTDISDGETWSNHVELGLWADLMIIAPATATTMAKMSNGIADNMLVASYLSAKCPVYIAPAMDLDMWIHGSTIQNIQKLKSYTNKIIPVGNGELASGLVGDGRMAEPEDIIDYIINDYIVNQDLAGRKITITAGPTYEAIDPVRYIGNHSSGKMGIALAEECAKRGGDVTLVLGPSKVLFNESGITVKRVIGAQEMYEEVEKGFDESNISIMAAAVADYTPETVSDIKIKKKEGDLNISLKRTIDIAKAIGLKKGSRIHVGFALETNNEVANAQMKLESKNLDLIVLNSLQDKGAGFAHETNKVNIYRNDGSHKNYELKSKKMVAIDIVNEIVALLKSK